MRDSRMRPAERDRMKPSEANQRWILALETSGRVGSVAVARGDRVLTVQRFTADQRHAVELLPTVQRLCHDAGFAPGQLDEVYVSTGPGSFTGLRIGITVARTLAWSAGASVVAVPTLEVIAQNALDYDPPPDALGVILDAKRGRIFAAAMAKHGDEYQRVDEPTEWEPHTFIRSLPAGSALMGEGMAYHQTAIQASGLPVLPASLNRPRAETVHRIGHRLALAGRYDDPRTLVPVYIRRPEAEEVWDRRHANPQPPGRAGSND